jgi:hypothetical protein
MTAGFGTENVCWVPEGECLRFVDLLHWTEWRLDLDRWRLALPVQAREALIAQTREALNLCRARAEKEPETFRDVEHAESFLITLSEHLDPPSESTTSLTTPLGPLASIWVRLSDIPLESFFEEDYRPTPEPVKSFGCISSLGALRLPLCDDLEVPLMGADPEDRIAVLTPAIDCVGEYPLPLDQPPPVLDEFCGLRGNSNRGKMVNLTLDAKISSDTPIATPLFRLGRGGGFATIYFHFQTPTSPTVLLPLPPGHVHRVESSLESQGFQRTLSERRNQIWKRDEDWVHCLWNIPGLESEDLPVLDPIIVVAQAEGSRDPALREALLAAILHTALGEVPDLKR